jgi:dTMP kinase
VKPTLLLALEGIDKSGKGTQSAILATKIRDAGRAVTCIDFPDYDTPLGKAIGDFLRGKITFQPEVRQLLYVANRWERKSDLDTWLREGRIVLARRYIYSGLAYGLANGLDLEWMLGLEKGLPAADRVFVLDISVASSFARQQRNRDVYERDAAFLRRVRVAYRHLARRFSWVVIDGERSPDEVTAAIWGHVAPLLGTVPSS